MFKLRELRIEKGFSMSNLAIKIGVSDAAISNWENGINEPKANYIVKLANIFNVSTDYLLGRENEVGFVEVTPTLTSDQQELLDLYDRMNYRDKNQLLGFAKGLVY